MVGLRGAGIIAQNQPPALRAACAVLARDESAELIPVPRAGRNLSKCAVSLADSVNGR